MARTLQTDQPLTRLPANAADEPIEQIVFYRALLIDPPYQRGDVWGPRRQRKLIWSLMSGVPIGNIFLNTRPGDEMVTAVVDGRQRIQAVRAFLDGRLTVPASWFAADQVAATEDTPDGPYVRFTGLTEIGQRRFLRARFTTQRLHFNSVEEEAALFDLINFGGLAQGEVDDDRPEEG